MQDILNSTKDFLTNTTEEVGDFFEGLGDSYERDREKHSKKFFRNK